MSLKDLKLKPVYYSDEDNILTEFYIPILLTSTRYDRIAGFFCSNSLAIAAKGISGLIRNGGRIRLIANVVISLEDQEAIKDALREKENQILIEIDDLEDQLQKDHIKMLGWMLKNRLLEIKIAVVSQGIEHQKIGIVYDQDRNIVSFSGSENETVGGWLNNDEQFHVFCSWNEGDNVHLKPDIERFDKLWNDRGIRVRVYPVSEAFNKGLINWAPKDSEEFIKVTKEIADELIRRSQLNIIIPQKSKKIELRDYQIEAIKNWKENNYKGIFEMATGTGKTFCALGGIKELNEDIGEFVVIISCPYSHLVQQWRDNIDEFNLDFEKIIADSSNIKWKSELMDKVYDVKNKILNKLIILTTHNTFASPDFLERVKSIKLPILFICDEVHGIGSKERNKGLIEELYKYRLGLSATPSRWFDEIGTEKIMDFFGKTVFEFSLKKAINSIDPHTGKTYLVKYDYKPIFIKLSDVELQQYEDETKKIARAYYITKDPDKKEELFNLLCIKRQKIITNSRAKYETFRELLKTIIPSKHCFIYVSPEQMDTIQSIISEFNIKQHKFTSEEGIIPEERFHGISESTWLHNYSNFTSMDKIYASA